MHACTVATVEYYTVDYSVANRILYCDTFDQAKERTNCLMASAAMKSLSLSPSCVGRGSVSDMGCMYRIPSNTHAWTLRPMMYLNVNPER